MSSPIYQAPTPSMGRGDGLGLQRRREEQEAKRQLKYAFDVKVFEDDTFDSSSFVRTRTLATSSSSSSATTTTSNLQQVREDLQNHLDTIQNNLLSLVHRDYADFVQLSSELEGVDKTLNQCRAPVVDLHSATQQLKDAAEFSLDTIRSSLSRHDRLESEHADMSEMLRALQVLALGEQLLVGGTAGKKSSDRRLLKGKGEKEKENEEEEGAKKESHVVDERQEEDVEEEEEEEDSDEDEDEDEENDKSDEAKIAEECATLERVSRLISHLGRLMQRIENQTNASGSGTTDGNNSNGDGNDGNDSNDDDDQRDRQDVLQILSIRTQVLKRRLLERLEIAYGTEVVPDGQSGRLVSNTDALSYCLRAYSSGDDEIQKEASLVFARLVIRPMLKEFVTQGRLDGKGARGSCEGLPNILECLSNLIKDTCRTVLRVTRRMNERSGGGGVKGNEEGEEEEERNIMRLSLVENGIWSPIAMCLEQKLGHQLFSLSNVDTFHRNYTTCRSFIVSTLPKMTECTKREQKLLVEHPTTKHFLSKFSLDIYYGLRMAGLTGRVRTAIEKEETWLSSENHHEREREKMEKMEKMESVEKTTKEEQQQQQQQQKEQQQKRSRRRNGTVGMCVVECIGRCWDDKIVYVDTLVVKWYELTESILNMYLEYVRERARRVVKEEEGGDDEHVSLSVVPLLYQDVALVSKALKGKLRERVISTLRKHHDGKEGEERTKEDDVDRASEFVCSLFDAISKDLEESVRTLWTTYSDNVVERSTNNIKIEVETIARNFRFHSKASMSKGKIVPNHYVDTMVMPLRNMEEDEVARSAVINVLDRVSMLYHGAVADMLDGARKTEASLQRMKKTAGNIAHMAGSSSLGGGDSGSSGLNKIVDQVSCDMRHYADIAKTMLRDGESSNGLEKLQDWLDGGMLS